VVQGQPPGGRGLRVRPGTRAAAAVLRAVTRRAGTR
jgi:hypothetical protein